MTDAEERTHLAPRPWMVEPATQAVLAALAEGGAAARFVGGAVRDALLGREMTEPDAPLDIDLATPAPPGRVVELLEKRGIKVVPTGLAHGTVTAIPGSSPEAPPRRFEITTLRRDIDTDGRHATVAFDADWAADAARRDFTINAIYLDPDGTIHDPVGGVADLRRRRVRFVGDPVRRIAEDVLRLLRYYRFTAQFGAAPGDAAARAACRAAARLLSSLSAERVAQELVKLLDTPDPTGALSMMREDGVLAIVLPEAQHLDRLARLIAIEPARDPLRRLAAIAEIDRAGAGALAVRLRLSNEWRERLQGLGRPWPLDPTGDIRAQHYAIYRLGVARYRDLLLLLAAAAEIDGDRCKALSALAASWEPPAFPIAGRDATALGVPPGRRVGRLLDAVRQWWEEGDFAADRARCLAELAVRVNEQHPAGDSRRQPDSALKPRR